MARRYFTVTFPHVFEVLQFVVLTFSDTLYYAVISLCLILCVEMPHHPVITTMIGCTLEYWCVLNSLHTGSNFSLWNASMYWLMDEWYNFTVNLLDRFSHVPQLVVAYSDLKQNSVYELERILNFIEAPYNQETLQCAVKPRVSPFRLQSVDRYLARANPYTRAQILRLDQLIQSLAPILSKHGIPYYNWYRFKS